MRGLLPFLLLAATTVAGMLLLPLPGWDDVARHQAVLLAWVSAHPVVAAGLFVAAYVVTTALSLPHGALQTALGGLLFGAVKGCLLAVVGATAGAVLFVLIVRSCAVRFVSRFPRRIPDAVRLRLARDGFLYLLSLRLMPLVPFWLVNAAAALAGLRLRVFVSATLIGIMPFSFILSSIGARLGRVLAAGGRPALSVLLAPRLLLPLVLLSALALLPTLLRRGGPDRAA